MKKLSELVKSIREGSGLSQREFASELEVSTIYISKIETDQKEVSKKFLIKLASYLDVHPSVLAPFLFYDEKIDSNDFKLIEKALWGFGERLQKKLINKRLKNENAA